MFTEDLGLGVVPYRSATNEGPAFTLAGADTETEKAWQLCASLSRYGYDRSEDIGGAIREIASYLAYHGEALFEILRDPSDATATLLSVSPAYVWAGPGFYFQFAPRQAWPFLKKKYSVLNSQDVWRIRMPEELGGSRGHRRILKQLSAWRQTSPRFVQSDVEKGQFPTEFSVRRYARERRIYEYRATRRWGWQARDWSLEHVTEFYQFYRFLTFKWAQAVLRESIISGLNGLFRRLAIDAVIASEALPSAQAILDARSKLISGTIDFAEASKLTRF